MRWTLVGRARVIDRCERPLGEGAPGVELAGEAGVGKTRLLEELTGLAESGGRRVIRLKASRSTKEIPLGALSHIVQPKPRLGETPEEAIWRTGRALVGPGKDFPLICLDDLHLLDDVSTAVLDRLVRDEGAQLLVTRRTDEPLRTPVQSLVFDGHLVHVAVRPLDEDGAREFAEEIVGRKIERASLLELWRTTVGNALFIREIIESVRENDGLSVVNGKARLTIRVPSEGLLRNVVEERLVHLSAEEKSALEVLSLSGPIGIGLAERLTESAALEGLERRRLIEWQRDGDRKVIQPSHTLYAEVIRNVMPHSRRRALFRALAEAAHGTKRRRRSDAILYATWGLAGGLTLGADALIEAAEGTFGHVSPDTAIRFARAAVDGGGGPMAELVYGEVLINATRPQEAIGTLTALLEARHDDAIHARAAQALAWGRFQSGDPRGAFELLEATRRSLSDPGLRDALAVQRAELGVPVGNYTTWRDLIDEILAKDPGSVQPRVFLSANGVTAAREGFCGFPASGKQRASKILELIGDNPEVSPLMRFRLTVVRDYCALSLENAGDVYERMLDQTPSERSSAWAPFEAFAGYAANQAGRPVTGLAHMARALDRLRGNDPLGQISYTLANAAEAAAQTGASDQALDYLAELDGLPSMRQLNFAPETARARASALLSLGEADAAAAGVEEFSRTEATMAGLLTLEAPLCHLRVLQGEVDAGCERLSQIVSSAEPDWVASAFLEHARALQTEDPEAMLAAAARLSALGREMRAAEAAAQAARTFMASEAPAKAFAASLRAEVCERKLEGATSPFFGELPAVLTTNERHAAERAATTTDTARAIGGELHKSARTIENQLRSAYAKLGIHGRDELRRLFAGYEAPAP